MSIASNVNRVTAAGNGSTTAFAFAVPFVANTDLVVILRAADGTETTQTLGTDYTVSGAGNPAGGTVTFGTAPATGVTVVIYRDVPLTQPMNLQDGGPLPASTANGAFDRITMQMQRLYERVARGINLRETDTPGAGMLEAAGNELTGLADGTQPSSAVTVEQLAAVTPVLDSVAAAAAASAASATSSASAASGSASAASGSAATASAAAVAAGTSETNAGNSATAAAASAAQSKINWRGQWLTATAYVIADAVQNGGSSYFCIAAHTAGSTTQPGVGASWQTVWSLMAAKGAAGAGTGDMIAATYDPSGHAADAFNRANHTGTQAESTITNLVSDLAGKASTSSVGFFTKLVETIKTAGYTVLTSDAGGVLVGNSSSSLTFTLPTVASSSGLAFFFRNIGVGALTLDGNGSETIEGATTLVMPQGAEAMLWSNGSVWRAAVTTRVATTAEAQTGTATNVYVDPAGVKAAVTAQMKLVQRAYQEYTTYAALTTALPIDDTVPTSTEGTQVLAISFTPKLSTNIIRVTFFATAGTSVSSTTGAAAFQGTACIGSAATAMDGSGYAHELSICVELSAGSTSSRTYSIRVGNNTGSAFLNGKGTGRLFGGTARAVLIIEELTP